MRQLIFILLTTLFLLGCNTYTEKKQKNLKPKVGLKETFLIKAFNVGTKISLDSNFTFTHNFFSYGCTGGFKIKKVLGLYDINANQIIFKPKQLIWMEDHYNHIHDSKLKFDTIPYYDSDSTIIQKKYFLLQQNSMKFLISDADYNQEDKFFEKKSNFITLANLYNSNVKQKANKNLLSNIDTVWNFKNLTLDKKTLNQHRNLFLDSIIHLKIASVKVHKKENELIPIYKIDIKKQKEIKVGMKLYAPKFKNQFIEVIDIKNNTCTAEGSDIFWGSKKLKAGTVVSTEIKN